MKSNTHSSAIPTDIVAQARAKVQEAYDLLEPYMKTVILTPQDRMRLLKMGPKTLDFVGAAFRSAKEYPNILPGHASIEEFEIDYIDASQLYELDQALDTVKQGISDLAMVAGSEAYQASLMVYASSKMAMQQKVIGGKVVYETLKGKYPNVGRRTAQPESKAE